MTSDKAFKAALIVVDLQEDFCPPVSSVPTIQARSDPRGVSQAHTKTSLRQTHPLSFQCNMTMKSLTLCAEWQFGGD